MLAGASVCNSCSSGSPALSGFCGIIPSIGSACGLGSGSTAVPRGKALTPAPIAVPAISPCAIASPMPSSHGLPLATFCHTCSCADCGISSKTPSCTPPIAMRLPTLAVFAASVVPAWTPSPSVPAAKAVSTSGKPSFVANRPPAVPIIPVPMPEPIAEPAARKGSTDSSVCSIC